MNYIEKELSEYLDDLLVAAKIEQPRTKSVASYDEYADSFINFKMPARIQVQFDFSNTEKQGDCLSVKYKNNVCHFSLVDGNALTKKIPDIMIKVIPYIKKLISDKKQIIIDGYREALDCELWRHEHPKKQDDDLICDSFWTQKYHGFKERKRPWLKEQTK